MWGILEFLDIENPSSSSIENVISTCFLKHKQKKDMGYIHTKEFSI